MHLEFLKDLDEYFCENYTNYDKLCLQPDYKMPVMNATKRLKDGRIYAYTLPSTTMRLSLQEKKAEVLASLKEGLFDAEFSFSFKPLSFWGWIKDSFQKYSFKKVFPILLARKGLTVEDAKKAVVLDEKVWRRILKGRYYPTKALIYRIGLCCALSEKDVNDLLCLCGYSYDFNSVRDVVISYLFHNGITNAELVNCAFAEYKITSMKM